MQHVAENHWLEMHWSEIVSDREPLWCYGEVYMAQNSQYSAAIEQDSS
jgi:hypothetical protein